MSTFIAVDVCALNNSNWHIDDLSYIWDNHLYCKQPHHSNVISYVSQQKITPSPPRLVSSVCLFSIYGL